MATSKAPQGGKSLVIVESPTKARTISKFLGNQFTVEASIGHVRDLPASKKELPDKYKGEDWDYLGVNVNKDFTPIYVVPAAKKRQVSNLRAKLRGAKDLYLATDEDREGEAISWHLCELLKPKVPVRRLVFHEITKEAIQQALAHPRQIDQGLVKAQETRRILDRLYGYDVSNLLWRKMGSPGGRRLSAGRVQSVAVRMIVQRERERMAFRGATFWDLLATFVTQAGETLEAPLLSLDGRKVPTGKDFDPATGELKDPNGLLLDEKGARQLADRLRSAEFRVTALSEKPYTTQPAAPFTTSTLQQEANRKLGYTARRTMTTAQSLYENGHITYMRTDSTHLARVAMEAARQLVLAEYGRPYLPKQPRIYRSTVKNAQEAHEAIRPAGHPFELPESLQGVLEPDEFRLFELIWKRTIASQMRDARGRRITITIAAGGAVFQATGKTIDFPGFLRAYAEGSDAPEAELADKQKRLPAVRRQDPVRCRRLEPKCHTTKPPARFTEALLTRELESKGIGRPSTYATILETIQARHYVFKRGNALVPTWVAFAVVRMLEEHLPKLVDYQFTAEMEDYLDAISRREAEHLAYLRRFYFGDPASRGHRGLKKTLQSLLEQMDARRLSRFKIGTPTSGTNREEICLRVGRYGPFLQQGDRTASVPNDLPPDELTVQKALELLDQAQQTDEPLGICPETGKPVFIKRGQFGPYVQLGTGEAGEKPKNAALLKGMEPSDVNLETALKLLSLPRTLGEHPETKLPVIASNGRYGPYVKCDSETRSLPDGLSPLDITLEQALELLAQPKGRGGTAGPARDPLKVFPASPVTGEPIRLLDGRYGPYVTDGTTNASLPKGAAPETITFERAVELLAQRAAKGARPSRKKKTASNKRGTRASRARGRTGRAARKKKP